MTFQLNRNLKTLGSALHLVSSEVLDESFIHKDTTFEDGLADKIYMKLQMRSVLKEEWINSAKTMYKEWLKSAFVFTYRNPNKD